MRDGAERLDHRQDGRSEAGLSVGGLRYHYASKHDLLEALVVSLIDGFERALADAPRGPSSRTSAYIAATLDSGDGDTATVGVLARAALDSSLLGLSGSGSAPGRTCSTTTASTRPSRPRPPRDRRLVGSPPSSTWPSPPAARGTGPSSPRVPGDGRPGGARGLSPAPPAGSSTSCSWTDGRLPRLTTVLTAVGLMSVGSDAMLPVLELVVPRPGPRARSPPAWRASGSATGARPPPRD